MNEKLVGNVTEHIAHLKETLEFKIQEFYNKSNDELGIAK